jgi:hypothetical protein
MPVLINVIQRNRLIQTIQGICGRRHVYRWHMVMDHLWYKFRDWMLTRNRWQKFPRLATQRTTGCNSAYRNEEVRLFNKIEKITEHVNLR